VGAAYGVQLLLNQSRLRPVNLSGDGGLFNVTLKCGNETHQLCVPNGTCLSNLTLPGVNNRMSITYHPSELTSGVDSLTANYRISRNPNGTVVLRFRPRPFRFLGLDKCNETCEEGRHLLENPPNISAEIVRLFIDPFARTLRVEQLHNEVDSFATRVLDEIAKNATVRLFTNHSQRLDIIRCTEPHRDWVRSRAVAKLSDPRNFTAHLKESKRCIAPVYRRIAENRTFFESAQKLFETMQRAKHLLERWRTREMPGDGPELHRFGERVHKIEVWFNDSVLENGQNPPWNFLPVKPKTWSDKWNELNHDLTKMIGKFGAGTIPRLMKRDGSQPTAEEWKQINDMQLMKGFQDMEEEQEKERQRQKENQQTDDDL
jgi:hypothetical protein